MMARFSQKLSRVIPASPNHTPAPKSAMQYHERQFIFLCQIKPQTDFHITRYSHAKFVRNLFVIIRRESGASLNIQLGFVSVSLILL